MKIILFTALPALCAVSLVSLTVYADNGGNEISLNERGIFWLRVKDIQSGPVRIDFSGQARVRYEYYDEYTLKGYKPGQDDTLLLARVRLELSALFWNGPRVFFQLQDAHAFLTRYNDTDFPESSPIEDTLDIRQLYCEWQNIANSNLGFRAGRQQIAYGDQRLFGPGNWGNTGKFAWDAMMIKADFGSLWADVWAGKYLHYQSDEWPNQPVDDFITFVTYAGYKRSNFRFDAFYVLKNDTSGTIKGESGEGDLKSHSVGFQTEATVFDVFDAAMTFVSQNGRYGRDKLRAYGVNAKIGFTAPVPGNPRIGGQLTRGSGDSDPNDGIHETFDGVYGGRDIYFYGYLNLFFWANIRDYQIDFSFSPHKTVTVLIEYHYFALDKPKDAWYSTGMKVQRRDTTGKSGTALGQEIDFRVTFKPWDHFEMMAGYGGMLPGSFIKNTGPSATARWYFFQSSFMW